MLYLLQVNEGETGHHCAIREVHEETGYDASHLISEFSYFERKINGSTVRLYLAVGVEVTFPFKPLTKNEIK